MTLRNIPNDWQELLDNEIEMEYFKLLAAKIEEEYEKSTVYPNIENIYNALKLTSYNDIKVVIIGQDPYHGLNQANGLAFSVKTDVKLPPSLRNIFKELHSDLNIDHYASGDLSGWAKQGVLLLNSCLTVRSNKPLSHKNIGWETFTDKIIKKINEKEESVIFVLWGKEAQKKQIFIKEHHKVLLSAHPSPLSAYRGFFGSKPFSKINDILTQKKQTEIDWSK